MENSKSMDTGFRIDNILLIESSFFRINNVVFDNSKVENEVNIKVEVNVQENTIAVAETVSFVQKVEGAEQVKIKVKMVGVFEVVGDTEIKDFEKFGKINGAAIIFPYIREHITNHSLKAGLGAIILPPANFTTIE